ncbi:MAG TPA: methylmalonyl-CoA mutase family protein [Fimbriimonas sp.]
MKLFEEFPPVSTDQWMDQVAKDLKGADYEKRLVGKTLDGLAIKPIYRKEDLPKEAASSPGTPPYLRGYKTTDNNWLNREQIRESDVEAANAHALRSLTRGAEELSILTYPIGVPINSQEEMRRFLEGIFIEMVPIHWQSGPYSAQTLAMLLNEADRRGIAYDQLSGSVEAGPIIDSAAGWTESPIETWKQRTIPIKRLLMEQAPRLNVMTVRGNVIEKAGASVAQELAFSMALLVEQLVALKEEGFDLAEVVRRTEVRYAVGSHYFLEIAKLRAHRVVVTNVLRAFGVEGILPKVHVDTTSSNKTLYDPYNNLLRGTTEAMAAAVAGVDSISVAAFDQGYHSPDEFSEHIARNTETLLKEEAFLGKVVDPLGGAYYVEQLTASLAAAAWDLFRQIEEQGGFVAAWLNGFIGKELDRIRAAKSKRIDTRRVPLVGTSVYPNLKERRLQDIGEIPKNRQLKAWSGDFDALRRDLKDGATLAAWTTDRAIPSTPLNPFRPSWPYEHLRLRVERHVAKGGRQPVVFLALYGDPVRRKARAGFATGFYGAGGYAIVEPNPFKDPEEAAKAAIASNADLVVLCSSDEEYKDWVKPMKDLLGDRRLVVAGAPPNMEELKADGADGFIHVKSDVVETLAETHRLVGIPEETV